MRCAMRGFDPHVATDALRALAHHDQAEATWAVRIEAFTIIADLQAMAGRLFSLQEDERRAISRDLHDDIGQAITAIKLSAHAAQDEDDPKRRGEDLAQIVSLADTTVAKLRDISTLLRPPQLDALGLEAALSWQARVLLSGRCGSGSISAMRRWPTCATKASA